MPIFSIPPDIQVPAAIVFSAGYAGLEAIALENYLRVLGTTKPKVGTLYSYHIFAMLPAFIGTSFLIGYDDRIFAAGYNPITDPEPALRSLANMIETFVPLVIMEDIFYFVIRGFDRRHPDTFKTYRIKKDDWTCKKFGCFDAGFTAVPKWYVAGAGLATLVWLLNNVVFPRPAP